VGGLVLDLLRPLTKGKMNGKDAGNCQCLRSPCRSSENRRRTTDNTGIALDRSPDWNHARDISEVALPIEEDYVPQPDDRAHKC
jgi:hypothetical protein